MFGDWFCLSRLLNTVWWIFHFVYVRTVVPDSTNDSTVIGLIWIFSVFSWFGVIILVYFPMVGGVWVCHWKQWRFRCTVCTVFVWQIRALLSSLVPWCHWYNGSQYQWMVAVLWRHCFLSLESPPVLFPISLGSFIHSFTLINWSDNPYSLFDICISYHDYVANWTFLA